MSIVIGIKKNASKYIVSGFSFEAVPVSIIFFKLIVIHEEQTVELELARKGGFCGIVIGNGFGKKGESRLEIGGRLLPFEWR
jgi:hypothetical protein